MQAECRRCIVRNTLLRKTRAGDLIGHKMAAGSLFDSGFLCYKESALEL
jgi:hypothetical protein